MSRVLIDAILRTWERQRDYAERLVADLSDADMVSQPVPGVIMNHPAWVYSHVGLYPPVLAAILREESFEDPAKSGIVQGDGREIHSNKPPGPPRSCLPVLRGGGEMILVEFGPDIAGRVVRKWVGLNQAEGGLVALQEFGHEVNEPRVLIVA